jgi:uncharacterized protein (DUF427 family)
MPMPEPYVEPTDRWIRVRHGDRWVADSRRALLLIRYPPHGGRLPTYALPAGDVDVAAAEALLADGTAERFDEAAHGIEDLRGMWTFTWDDRIAWFEEAEQVGVHARDPHKRVDVLASERHVRIELDGKLLADSRRPLALFETHLPIRWYLPREDVTADLAASPTQTGCPYKGTATYWSVPGADDIAWTYREPIAAVAPIAGRVAFFDERVDVTIDGERQERPITPFSPR